MTSGQPAIGQATIGPAAIGRRRGALGGRALDLLLPALIVGVVIGLWQLSDSVFGIPVYMLPRPSDFLPQFWLSLPQLWQNAVPTTLIILGGFLLGTAVAVPLALAIAASRLLERGLLPALVVLQIAPKTIVAPLLIVWLGTGWMPQLALTTVMTFFPILVDAIAGFRAVDPRLYHVARSMGATRWQTFRHIRLPAAMPAIFSGLKIGMVSAITGAVVVEFVASNAGLGYLTMWASSHLDMELMFAAILTTALLGLVLNMILVSLEMLLMPWMRHFRHG
ncbi:MAG: ABC transporter permease [Dongiaceae bacterium]